MPALAVEQKIFDRVDAGVVDRHVQRVGVLFRKEEVVGKRLGDSPVARHSLVAQQLLGGRQVLSGAAISWLGFPCRGNFRQRMRTTDVTTFSRYCSARDRPLPCGAELVSFPFE